MLTFAAGLETIIKNEALRTPKETTSYSEDTSIFKTVPVVAVCPKDARGVEAVVWYVAGHKASERHLSITGRVAGQI